MDGVTNPAEACFKDGIWAWDASAGAFVKLLADASGYLKVAEQAPITGFATSAKQDTMITALQLIDDLRSALASVDTDELGVKIQSQAADVEVKQTTPADLRSLSYGYVGGEIAQQPLVFGVSYAWTEWLGGTQSGAGQYEATTAPVPAGYVYVLQKFFIQNASGARGSAFLRVYDGTNPYYMAYSTGLATWEPLLLPGPFVLIQGHNAAITMNTCLDGDDVRGGAWGYKMIATPI